MRYYIKLTCILNSLNNLSINSATMLFLPLIYCTIMSLLKIPQQFSKSKLFNYFPSFTMTIHKSNSNYKTKKRNYKKSQEKKGELLNLALVKWA